jgi:hypothetical protein
MRIAVGDVTVNTNGHARPFLHFRLREEGRIDDDDVGMTGEHFPVTEDTARVAIFMRNFKIVSDKILLINFSETSENKSKRNEESYN